MKHGRKWTLASGAIAFGLAQLLAAPCGARAQASDAVAIKAKRIIPVNAPPIDDGVVIVRAGKIAAIGKSAEIPEGASVLEAAVVFPGMVEAHGWRGMDAPNENVAVVPFVNTADGVDPLHFAFEDALRDGITTIHVIPGNGTVVGGTGIIVKPVGGTVDSVILKRQSAMKLSLSPGSGRNRIAQVNELRKAFEDYDRYVEQLRERQAEQKKTGARVEEFDAKQVALRDMLEGRLPAFVYCPTDGDVARAMALVETRKLKAVFVLSPECYRSAEYLAKKRAQVVLDGQLVTWETDEERDREVRHVLPLIYHRAGVKYALQIQGGSEAGRYLWYQAATAVKFGVPRDVALRSITLTPAEAIGMSDRVGSIEVGKDANLLLLTGDPLKAGSWIDKVLVEGRVVYDRSTDKRLQRLLTGKEGD